ncbi:MAG: hypothetical protein JWO38_1777 [Gemmataceae bacterium]|nr:hypothetical protein [Gemmataceae bacterium]
MADVEHLYPSAPANVPPDLAAPSGSYRARVIVVLISLTVFAAIYLGLIVGSAYLGYSCFAALGEGEPKPARTQPVNSRSSRTYDSGRSSRGDKPSPIFLVAGGISSWLLCLFLVKGLFKRSRSDPGVRVELTEKGQPDLFAFIRRLCQDTRAPFPHRVYLVPDVNAAVAYHESPLNLILPARKNLIIGLGLVNRLNLTEFKAVLAHEFGHFSQKSMKLGRYVYTANRVMADVVYGRDWLDDLVGTLRRTDIRIAVFAWAFTGVLWVLRKGLEHLFKAINFANSSLSRQMEYNADLVAASVSGSDSLVFALARLDFAGEVLGQAWTDLMAAADHERFSRDLYYHQTRAAEYLRLRRNDPTLGEVPALPDDPQQTVQVFKPEDMSVPKMWATHPANHDREVNAKRRYVRSPIDDRSSWALFRDLAGVREAVTRRLYETARRAKPAALEDPEVIQAFIDAEHAETTYHPRYHGLYDDRYVRPGDLDELLRPAAHVGLVDPVQLATAHARLYGDELTARMKAHKARHQEASRLTGLARGAVQLIGKDFEFRGTRYRQADAGRLLKDVETELGQDYEWMHALDREVFLVHDAMATQLGETDRRALEERYRFHTAIQDVYGRLVAHNQLVQATLNGLSGRREIPSEEFQNAVAVLRQAHDAVGEQLAAAHQLRLPPLTNMTVGTPLGPYLLSQPLVRNLRPDTTSLDGQWIGQFLGQVGEVIERTQRTLFKSLGGLLAVQEGIAERWAAAQLPASPVEGA